MGKAYVSEARQLPDTYRWALRVDVQALAECIGEVSCYPLVAVGSGGSYSAAAMAAWLHEHYALKIGRPSTPLELIGITDVRSSAALVLSGAGRNVDIVRALKWLISREPSALAAVCLTKDSPLIKLAGKFSFVGTAEYEIPSGKDGFVATNSLLALCVLLLRAYTSAAGRPLELPNSLDRLLAPAGTVDEWEFRLKEVSAGLWNRPYLLVLYGSTTRPAAIDIESKFSEAALGAVQLADFRNFAHGRHHWLAKKGEETSVLCLFTDEDKMLADRTLDLLPRGIAVGRIYVPGRAGVAALAAVAASLYITKWAGEAKGIDPGRPGVPEFGRRIYHLNAWGKADPVGVPRHEAAAISRKALVPLAAMEEGELAFWRRAYQRFLERLTTTAYEHVVFDYDGTLCDRRHRFDDLPREVTKPLNLILSKGTVIGIATGRGGSAHEALRKAISRRYWKRVFIGYYNCSEIGSLSDGPPRRRRGAHKALAGVIRRLEASPIVDVFGKPECRFNQITIAPRGPIDTDRLYRTVCDLIVPDMTRGVTCVRSSHSVDILAPGITKANLLYHLTGSKRGDIKPCLCIGDLGAWPGNDFALLGMPYSLSVNEVSSDPETCWNLAPPGYRNDQAVLFYLDAMKVLCRRVLLQPVLLAGQGM